MNLNLIDQTELLRREHGRTLYEGAEGSVLCSPDGRTVFSDILDIPRLRALLQALTPPQTDTFFGESAQAADLVTELFGMTGRTDCAQWVYCRDAAPDFDRSIDIHPMPREDVPLAAPHYSLLGDCTEFFYEQSAAGRLFGLYEGGRLAGFIGLHHEGSMGMLEILPEFRRRGLRLCPRSLFDRLAPPARLGALVPRDRRQRRLDRPAKKLGMTQVGLAGYLGLPGLSTAARRNSAFGRVKDTAPA